MSENNNDLNIIDYRLSAIEKELKELKELLITVPLLASKMDNVEKGLDEKYATLEKRIDAAEVNIDLLNKELSKVRAEPDKKNAAKWQLVVDIFYKTAIAAAIGYLFVA